MLGLATQDTPGRHPWPSNGASLQIRASKHFPANTPAGGEHYARAGNTREVESGPKDLNRRHSHPNADRPSRKG
eukprot:2531526-Lingulodinium_polyedra.AAC.1